jgi:predicted RNase H-like HicB family nuclease
MKYAYPAIFTEENDGGYSVLFPDFDGSGYGCFTQGNDINDTMDMAEDALCLVLYNIEKADKTAPKASNIKDVAAGEKEFVSLITCDTDTYKRFYESKAVKKTLSIPAWLNSQAEKNSINFSQLLQEALKQRLGL